MERNEQIVGANAFDEEFSFWPDNDVFELCFRVRQLKLFKDNVKSLDISFSDSNWETIRFGNYSTESCKTQWEAIKRVLLVKNYGHDAFPLPDFFHSIETTKEISGEANGPFLLFFLDQRNFLITFGIKNVDTQALILGKYWNILDQAKRNSFKVIYENKKKELNDEIDRKFKNAPEYITKEPKIFFKQMMLKHSNMSVDDARYLWDKISEEERNDWKDMHDKYHSARAQEVKSYLQNLSTIDAVMYYRKIHFTRLEQLREEEEKLEGKN